MRTYKAVRHRPRANVRLADKMLAGKDNSREAVVHGTGWERAQKHAQTAQAQAALHLEMR